MKTAPPGLEEGKLYYSISEVCRMTGLEPHVLRYWENEFAQMRPRKNRAGNRAYRAKEIQYIHYIRYLLHNERFTILGARKKLAEVTPEEVSGQLSLLRPDMFSPGEESAAQVPRDGSGDLRRELEGVREGLREVLRLLGAAKD